MSTSWWRRVRPARQQPKKVEPVPVMSTWAIWGGAVILLAIASVSTYVLLAQFGAGTPEDRVRLEAIRLAGTIVIGSGGGVALLLAARRQRTSELSLKQQQHDADERRITELYTAAAEQLGSDKAPVRLAALYALERLGNDHPDHRQIVIDLFCAYLRMPFTPPDRTTPATHPAPERPNPHSLGLRPPRRPPQRSLTSELRDAVATITGTMPVKSLTEQAQQELEVRLTAQRLITNHLQIEIDNEKNVHLPPTFWGNIDLDLTGATLIDWGMYSCLVGECTLTGATFYDHFGFRNSIFCGNLWADKATFHGFATWNDVTFLCAASFGETTFHEAVILDRTHFGDQAQFSDTTFHGNAVFRDVSVEERAWFDGATFRGRTLFHRNDFHDTTLFNGATFHEDGRFKKAIFHADAEFDNVKFYAPTRSLPPNGWRLESLEIKSGQNANCAVAVRDVPNGEDGPSTSPTEP